MNTTDLKQFSQLLDEKLNPIQKEIKEHSKILNEQGKMLKSLKRDQDTIIKVLDKEQMDQKKRLKKVEDHLGFPQIVS